MPTQTIDGPLGALADVLGGVAALGEALGGTDPSTIWRWANGKTKPAPAAARLVFDLCEANHITPPEWARFRRAPVVKTWTYEDITRAAERRIRQILAEPLPTEFLARKLRYDVAYGVFLAWTEMTEGARRGADEDRLRAMTEMPEEEG